MVTSSIPLQEQLAEVGREIAMRHSVYPRRVRDGKMTQAQADRQIAIMKSVYATIEELAKNEEIMSS